MKTEHLRREYDRLHAEATRLAGGLTDLAQRATVYHHIFRASGGAHIFPLIAAHGALWAGGYFRWGMKLGRMLAWQYIGRPEVRKKRLEQLEDFANAFRDINRRVCIDIYTNYHFTAEYGEHLEAAQFVTDDLLAALRRIHAARREGRELDDDEKREVFLAHFLNEQKYIVGPAIEQATTSFDWPVLRFIALRPIIRFAYFDAGDAFRFGNFSRTEERIEKGLRAFNVAARVGWSNTEQALRRYEVLPEVFFLNPVKYFDDFRAAFLATA